MSEFTPDLSDESRCISAHWSMPVQCVLPRTHRDNWHEAWHPETGNRLRYRYSTRATEELHHGEWHEVKPPQPGPGKDLTGAVRRSPNGTRLAVLWPSPPHPDRWIVTDRWGSTGYESDEAVADWPVVGAVPFSPAAGMELTPIAAPKAVA